MHFQRIKDTNKERKNYKDIDKARKIQRKKERKKRKVIGKGIKS